MQERTLLFGQTSFEFCVAHVHTPRVLVVSQSIANRKRWESYVGARFVHENLEHLISVFTQERMFPPCTLIFDECLEILESNKLWFQDFFSWTPRRGIVVVLKVNRLATPPTWIRELSWDNVLFCLPLFKEKNLKTNQTVEISRHDPPPLYSTAMSSKCELSIPQSLESESLPPNYDDPPPYEN
jgi:hypothetical protein